MNREAPGSTATRLEPGLAFFGTPLEWSDISRSMGSYGTATLLTRGADARDRMSDCASFHPLATPRSRLRGACIAHFCRAMTHGSAIPARI